MKKPSRTVTEELYPGLDKRSRQGRINRTRGGEYEREVANALKPIYPKARRSVGQAREGANAPDVVGTPLWIECTKSSGVKVVEKMAQGLVDSAVCPDPNYRGRAVVVFSRHKPSRLDLVTMRREDFLELLRDVELIGDT